MRANLRNPTKNKGKYSEEQEKSKSQTEEGKTKIDKKTLIYRKSQ